MRFGLALVLGLIVQGCSAQHPPPISPSDQHGFALAYIKDQLAGSFRLETTITMPPHPENKGWTANYIMIAGARTDRTKQPMYQVGLIRLAASPDVLRSFWATAPLGGPQVDYKEIGVESFAPHRVALAARNGTLTIEVDGLVVRTFKRDTVFPRGDHLYIQIGSEAIEPGDAVAGSFRDISLSAGGAMPRRMLPACRFNDRGLALRRDEKSQSLEAGGTYTPGAPSVFVDCQ